MRLRRSIVVGVGAAWGLASAFACTSFSEESSVDASVDSAASEASLDGGGATDGRSDVGPPPSGSSCKEILAAHPERAGYDGIYPLSSIGDAGQAKIYCDMTIENGGWTLVGRSALGGGTSTSFGWNKLTGAVDDPAFPYSLDAIGLGIAFDQILVADRGPAGGVGEIAFRLRVPADFAKQRTASVDVRPAVYVRGPCSPQGGPEMLRFAGATANNNNFFLRDIAGTDIRNGLDPGGFDLAYDDCRRGGLLYGKQGVILVR